MAGTELHYDQWGNEVNWFEQFPPAFLDQTVRWLKELEQFYRHTLGLELFLCYGTLLGAVRAEDFIPHDYDIDLAVLSQRQDLPGIRAEYKTMVRVLEETGRLVEEESPGLVRVKGDPGRAAMPPS